MGLFKRKRENFESFLNRIPDLDLVQKYAERSNKLLGEEYTDLTFLKYQTLKHTIPGLLEQGKIEAAIFEIAKEKNPRTTEKEVQKESHYLKLRFFFWIQEQYKAIAQLEQQYLVLPPRAKLVNAGIKELDILGDINIIDELAGGDVLKWDAIRQLPYEQIFNKQLRDTILKKINRKLEKDKNPET